ncbi:Scarecrow-like protein 9 [Striga hermonthica]|uniref:Scarecrow-like protein 9 n=1 Tax=Striga hermonthica TaxID=68872 RepID=A0A9N7RGB0_STRHE|nr:Scarecrow-like protein 9 [Striga hermonthica]
MDPHFPGPFSSSDEFQPENQFPGRKHSGSPSVDISCLNHKLAHGHSFQERRHEEPHFPGSKTSTDLFVDRAEDEDNDDHRYFSDSVLRYIDQMLMEEEDLEDNIHMLHESLDFRSKERSFYELLGQKYPPSPDSRYVETPHNNQYSSDDVAKSPARFESTLTNSEPFSPSSDASRAIWSFRKGFVVASKFLLGKNDDRPGEISGSGAGRTNPEAMGKKNINRHADKNDLEEHRRRTKIPAIYDADSDDVPVEEFDNLLLFTRGESERKFFAYREELKHAGSKNELPNQRSKKKKKKKKKKEEDEKLVDLRTLLIGCAKSIAADDWATAKELLEQVRSHSSPHGNGDQRLGHYFADGLEARLTGTGSEAQKSLIGKRATASSFLRAYYTYLASAPFVILSSFLAGKTIQFKSEKAAQIHVIDFGIMYGFQWPTFIQRVVEQAGGPPSRIRITGIDFPQPGFRPAERVEETGRRLARYAEMFGVPFEYRAIARKWETIKPEDFEIEEGEYVVVSCMYRAGNLMDETFAGESPRDAVLGLVRRVKPEFFVHGVVNGIYGAPFFVTRFREALFSYSSIFDMLETSIPRENTDRLLLERDVFGKEVMNVVACEGWERIERPETYKQWHVRHLRAGLEQVEFDRRLVDSAVSKLSRYYHREFVVDEDNQWLLMGWKERILYALSLFVKKKMEAQEECTTPKSHEHRIPAALVCPPPPRKKNGRRTRRPEPENGYFQSPEVEKVSKSGWSEQRRLG